MAYGSKSKLSKGGTRCKAQPARVAGGGCGTGSRDCGGLDEVEAYRLQLYRAARRIGLAVPPQWGRMLAAMPAPGARLPAQQVLERIVGRADALGLGRGVMARMAGAYPAVLRQPVGVLARRLAAVGGLLGSDLDEARRIAGREPRVLLQRLETTAAKFAGVVQRLGLDAAGVRQVVRRWPGVLAQRPDAIMDRMASLGAMLGLAPEALRTMVVRQPTLLGLAPERLAANLRALAEGLAVGEDVVKGLVRRMPQVLYQRPVTVLGRLAGIAAALGVDDGQVRIVALRQPALLLRRPESVAERARWLMRIGRACGDAGGIGNLMQRVPIAVNFSIGALRMRYILACLLRDGLGYRSVLLVAAERAESRIGAVLFERLGEGRARGVLERMRGRGLLVGPWCR